MGFAVSRKGKQNLSLGWKSYSRENILSSESSLNPKPDCLIHLEVKHHVMNPTAKDERMFHQVNVVQLNDWLSWCERHQVERVIYFSSIKAVSGGEGLLDELATGPGESIYGRTKWQAECRLKEWAEADPRRRGLIVRPAVIYGPGNRANMYSFVSAIERKRFFLVGQNQNIKSIVSLKNVVSAVHYLSHRMKPGLEVYNLVDRQNYGVEALASMISRALGQSGRIRRIPMWTARAMGLMGDVVQSTTGLGVPLTSDRVRALTENTEFSCRKLMESGYKHAESTEDGIKNLVNWFLQETRESHGNRS